jgi:hypothetical protein
MLVCIVYMLMHCDFVIRLIKTVVYDILMHS